MSTYILSTLDFETDPFLHGREPLPFCCGLYTEKNYVEFWGDDCAIQLYQYLCRLETPLRIYAHNGGKFDFYFFLKEQLLESDIFIINGRITKAYIDKHELRDSYAILPVPLSAYSKDDIDYSWFESDVREKHKKKILKYLHSDCINLYKFVSQFIDRFGPKLTIGSTAIKELRKMHPFECQNKNNDERFRPFYFGGRVQCFETGIIKAPIKVYDVNSMYPFVMRNYWHPCGGAYEWYGAGDLNEHGDFKRNNRKGWPYFIRFTGKNYGALPVRTKLGLDFNCEYGEFLTTSHEFKIALKYGLVEVEKIHEIIKPRERINFAEYVDRFIDEKISAKKSKDKAGEIFAKLLLNSAYGKTAQNPASYYNYLLSYSPENRPEGDNWELHEFYGDIELWKTPSEKPVYYDVAIGASITSAARSVLLEALQLAERPIYCDTDSIICTALNGVKLDAYELGAWDLEASGDTLAVAGKKLYAVMNKKECVKKATKGAHLESEQIFNVAGGITEKWENQAPSFSRTGEARFISRNIKRT